MTSACVSEFKFAVTSEQDVNRVKADSIMQGDVHTFQAMTASGDQRRASFSARIIIEKGSSDRDCIERLWPSKAGSLRVVQKDILSLQVSECHVVKSKVRLLLFYIYFQKHVISDISCTAVLSTSKSWETYISFLVTSTVNVVSVIPPRPLLPSLIRLPP